MELSVGFLFSALRVSLYFRDAQRNAAFSAPRDRTARHRRIGDFSPGTNGRIGRRVFGVADCQFVYASQPGAGTGAGHEHGGALRQRCGDGCLHRGVSHSQSGPAVFRRGALTAAFLPVFVGEMEQSGRPSAWKVGSAVLMLLSLSLCLFVLLAELGLWCIAAWADVSAEAELLIRSDGDHAAVFDFDLPVGPNLRDAARLGAFYLAGVGAGAAQSGVARRDLVDRPAV